LLYLRLHHFDNVQPVALMGLLAATAFSSGRLFCVCLHRKCAWSFAACRFNNPAGVTELRSYGATELRNFGVRNKFFYVFASWKLLHPLDVFWCRQEDGVSSLTTKFMTIAEQGHDNAKLSRSIFTVFFLFSTMISALRLRPLPDERERSNVIKTQSFRPL